MKPYHRNPRSISKKRAARLADTLKRLGDLGGIIHNVATDEIIGGNQRSRVFGEASKVELVEKYDKPDAQGTVAHGFIVWKGSKFAYRQVQWDEDTAAEANIAANIGAGEWDADILANQWDADLLKRAGMDNELLDQMNREAAMMKAMLEAADAGASDVDAEPQIDKADELREKWQTTRGQVWQLDTHRLMCGDSTSTEDVARLMGGEKAQLAPVDPPYNVGFDYDGSTVDDKKNTEEYERFSRAWFGECQRVSDRQIVSPGCYNLATWLRMFDAKHWSPWTKTNSMTNGVVSRFWCWEPVLFFGEKWPRKRANDIFNYPIGQQKDVANHPCPKPLEMWKDLIDNYSEPGAVIFESFSGSGTTIIACEQLGRKCRAMEISPAYVAVALERWATATGKSPTLIEHE